MTDVSRRGERTDTLLALSALFFGFQSSDNENSKAGDAVRAADFTRSLALSDATDRAALEKRAAWYDELAPEQRVQWTRNVLARVRNADQQRVAVIDRNIHHSQIAEALRLESPRVQRLILKCLPIVLARPVALDLGLVKLESLSGEDLAWKDNSDALPAEGVMAVIGRTFASRFVRADALDAPTALDTLKATDLARLIHMLGIRETAVACRGVESVESIASFLQRFPAEDVYAIATQITRTTTLNPTRLEFAQKCVEYVLSFDREASAMLDHLGLLALSVALETYDDDLRVRFSAQKLPVDVAKTLVAYVGAHPVPHAAEVAAEVVGEALTLADNLQNPGRGASWQTAVLTAVEYRHEESGGEKAVS